jgi:hypothetical protein
MSSGDIFAGLTKVANLFVEAVKVKVNEMNVPHEISDVIYIDPPKMIGENRYAIEVRIPMKDGSGAEAAAAFEWGSGEHGRGKGPYIIPKEGFGLKIAQEDWPGFEFPVKPGPRMVGQNEGGDFILRYVIHPGVAAKPYISPAILAVMEEAIKILGKAVRTELSVLDGKGTEVIIIQ